MSKQDNTKVIEGISDYLSEEIDATHLSSVLDNVFYMLSMQHAQHQNDFIFGNVDLHTTLHVIHGLSEVFAGRSESDN